MDMADRIERAKAKAELAYTEKLERAKAYDRESEHLTPEELDSIIDSALLCGGIDALDAVQRYERIRQAALWLDAHCMDVVSVEAEQTIRPHSTIRVELRRLASLQGKALHVFTAMSALADSLSISGVKDASIRVTFAVTGLADMK